MIVTWRCQACGEENRTPIASLGEFTQRCLKCWAPQVLKVTHTVELIDFSDGTK